MDEIIFYNSRWRAVKMILLTLPFVAASLHALFFNKQIIPTWLAWAGLVFFGIYASLSIFNLLDRRPQLIINETGIFDRSSNKDFINWNTIDHAYWNTIYGQRFVCLIIKDEYKQLIKGKSFFKRISMAIGMQEININLNELNEVDQEKLTALIINLSNAKPSDRNKLLSQTRPLAH